MSIKHRYIINQDAFVAYDLGTLDFKSNTIYTTFKHSELKQLPEHAYNVITQNLNERDTLRVETIPDAAELALYEVIKL